MSSFIVNGEWAQMDQLIVNVTKVFVMVVYPQIVRWLHNGTLSHLRLYNTCVVTRLLVTGTLYY